VVGLVELAAVVAGLEDFALEHLCRLRLELAIQLLSALAAQQLVVQMATQETIPYLVL
jgi:hypothetical protein